MINLSVIIPTRNRADLLEKTLNSIITQTYPQTNFEIIVIDNGSIDNTKEIAKSFQHTFPNFTYIYEPKPGLHVGRHAGLKASHGDILVYADDDIEALPTWLEGIAESFQDPEVALVGGNNIPNYEIPPPIWVEELWQKTPWGRTIGIFSIIEFKKDTTDISPYYVYGCNFSIRKVILLEVGGFHPDGMPDELLKYRGDGESAVSEAILQKGYKTIFNPKASVYHWVPASRMTPEYLFKRGYIQGISNSYIEIRKNNGLSVNKFVRNILQYLIITIKISVREKIERKQNLYLHYQKGFIHGYFFHQRMTKSDKELQKWVRKKDYYDHVNYPETITE